MIFVYMLTSEIFFDRCLRYTQISCYPFNSIPLMM